MFSANSTSIHQINADYPLSRLKRQMYMLFNKANNSFGHTRVDQDLSLRNFDSVQLDDYWTRLFPTSSPSRKLSDLFWMAMPWADIGNELGEIKVLDIGCGTGDYGLRMVENSNKRVTRYTGVDVKANAHWDELMNENTAFQFTQIESDQLPIPDGTNFIMSQSVLEHVAADLSYFKQISDFVSRQNGSVLQVHLMPAAACLKTYGYHGVRQYTPRTVSKLSRLFNKTSYSMLIGLGGEECNKLHRDYITQPLKKGLKDQRMERTSQYDSALYEAMKSDMTKAQMAPCFYALVIHSRWKTRLL